MNIIKSFTYGESIAEKTPVKFSQEGIVVKATSASDKVCGIALFTGEEGAKGDVLMQGLGVAAVKGACNAGDFLGVDASAKLKAVDLSALTEDVVLVGRVLETASADANLSVIVNIMPVLAPATEETQLTE